jgi:hypothetical protein
MNAEINTSGGHEAKFTNRRVYPIKSKMKHYLLRISK